MERDQSSRQVTEQATVTGQSGSTDGESASGLRLVVRRVRVSTGAKAGDAVVWAPTDGTGGNGHKVW